MSQDNKQDLVKEQHQQLSAVIRGLHKQLRRAYRENDGDHAVVWEHHTRDRAGLQHYAQAMHLLATQHWAAHPDTRIQWCRRTALEYFTGGGMHRALEKDARRRMRSTGHLQACQNTGTKEEVSLVKGKELALGEAGTAAGVYGAGGDGDEVMKNIQHQVNSLTKKSLPAKCRLRLLDVGSCYNPFLECPEFDSIGLDLSPATKSVYQCDFLKLNLAAPLASASSSTSDPSTSAPDLEPECLTSALGLSPDTTGSGPVSQLPRASFHVVVFSLLLEYLPAAVQRWSCCVKAHELLLPHGLLLIITPDSNSAYRNAPMMKSWRQALEHIGFQRWKYHKMEHVHCMAFRKVGEKAARDNPESVQRLLYIPQDFNDACYDDDHLPASLRSEHSTRDDGSRGVDPEHEAELENFLLSCTGELPLLSLDEEAS